MIRKLLSLLVLVITIIFSIVDCAPSFTRKQCEMDDNCQYSVPSRSILIAIDGTASRKFFGGKFSKFQSKVGVNSNQFWIWVSHVANFYEDYQGQSYYFYGPDSSEMINANKEVEEIVRNAQVKVCDFVSQQYNQTSADELLQMTLDKQFGIDITGFSRGGFAAMELSRKLQFDGCNGIRPIPVRFLGLYDPVQRDLDWDDFVGDVVGEVEVCTIRMGDRYDNEKIGSNVLALSLAERSEWIHSRSYFGYAVHGFDDRRFPSQIHRRQWNASHSGLGGAPGLGDCVEDQGIWRRWAGKLGIACAEQYTVAMDKSNSAKLDSWMRRNAIQAGVPILATDENDSDGYYNGFIKF